LVILHTLRSVSDNNKLQCAGDLQAQLESIFKTTITKEIHVQVLADLKQHASQEQAALQRQVVELKKLTSQVKVFVYLSLHTFHLDIFQKTPPSMDEDTVRLKSDLLDANMRLEQQQLRLVQLERQQVCSNSDMTKAELTHDCAQGEVRAEVAHDTSKVRLYRVTNSHFFHAKPFSVNWRSSSQSCFGRKIC
jgi:hypothetical protein